MPTLKETRQAGLEQAYTRQEAVTKRLHAEVASLIESGDFSLAAMRSRDLAQALEALNETANHLADIT